MHVVDYPFANRLYAGALDVLENVQRSSDGSVAGVSGEAQMRNKAVKLLKVKDRADESRQVIENKE